jgi:hypothetical protein
MSFGTTGGGDSAGEREPDSIALAMSGVNWERRVGVGVMRVSEESVGVAIVRVSSG